MTENKKVGTHTLGELVADYLDSNKDTLMSLQDLHALIVQEAERPLIELILKRTSYNQSKTAAILGINRNTLKKKMIILQLSKTKEKND